jgi:hypothetical protein
MGPRWARRPEEGSPQESAGVPANTRERARKKANRERLTFMYWWCRQPPISNSFPKPMRNPSDQTGKFRAYVRFPPNLRERAVASLHTDSLNEAVEVGHDLYEELRPPGLAHACNRLCMADRHQSHRSAGLLGDRGQYLDVGNRLRAVGGL